MCMALWCTLPAPFSHTQDLWVGTLAHTLLAKCNFLAHVSESLSSISSRAPKLQSLRPSRQALRLFSNVLCIFIVIDDNNSNYPTMLLTRSQTKVYNDLSPHVFEECSDLPNLSLIGIFSCHVCDVWRERVNSARRSSTPRHELTDHYQCNRRKTKSVIRVWIVCGQAPVVNNAEESPLHDETAKPKAKKAKYWKRR